MKKRWRPTKSRIYVGALLLLLSATDLAATPELALKQMIEADMAGDPDVRLSMSTPNTSIEAPFVRDPQARAGYFRLDTDAMELATGLRVVKEPPSCSERRCSVAIAYRVVAKTLGDGAPAWNRAQGREIIALPKPIERIAKYRLVRLDNQWKILRMPVPFVDPGVVRDFLAKEMKKAGSLPVLLNADERVTRNREVVRAWRQRQLDTLAVVQH
jgi:hypothetical protein